MSPLIVKVWVHRHPRRFYKYSKISSAIISGSLIGLKFMMKDKGYFSERERWLVQQINSRKKVKFESDRWLKFLSLKIYI